MTRKETDAKHEVVVAMVQEAMKDFAATMNARVQALEESARAEDPRCTCLGLTFSNTGHAAWCPVTTEVTHG